MRYITPTIILLFVLSIFVSSCDQGISSYQGDAASPLDNEASTTLNEQERKIIKTAEITLAVNELEPSIFKLKSFLKPIDGYVYNYEIQNNSYELDQYQKSPDSMVSVEKITPEGHLAVRVPIQSADTFINYVLNGDARITSLRITDDDITETFGRKKVLPMFMTVAKKQNKPMPAISPTIIILP